MSLINDALQRAKQSQPAKPPLTGSPVQFRPVEPPSKPKVNPLLIAGVIMGGIVVSSFVLISAYSKFKTAVLARTAPPTNSAPAPNTRRPASLSEQSARPTAPSPQITHTVIVTNVITNASPAKTVVPVTPPKLQAIVFNSSRPSAIINKKTVFVGSHVADFRVVSITVDSVTLINESQTNVLTLE
jgi:hypothetical protein